MIKSIFTKKQLAIMLSKISPFENPSAQEEQYMTDSETAADILWNAYMLGDITGKKIADFGAGTGILGIGALLLNAKQVTFVEKERNAIAILQKNLATFFSKKKKYTLLTEKIESINDAFDTVLENPPFGTRSVHADTLFLAHALHVSTIVYSIHKTTTNDFIMQFAQKQNAPVTHAWNYALPLKQTMAHHQKRIQRISVTCYRLVKER